MYHTYEERAELELQLAAAKEELFNLVVVDYDSANREQGLLVLIDHLTEILKP